MVVMEHLFNRFPEASSGQLTWPRTRAVCAPSLALVGVRELSLSKYLLHNNLELGMAISHYLTIFESATYSDMVFSGWRYDPPKVLSDLAESVFGAIFVDSGYDYELCKALILRIFQPLFSLLSPNLPLDPASELLIWVGRSGCMKTSFR